ncbi:hypothetical protein Tco_1017467 [Tanacetum coccineum]|uniref:Uncharacterized protein n=1 Tax=Tanacetum coccineum TaxID=301880 RepID=A0ABQ5FRJ8_9ASTR
MICNMDSIGKYMLEIIPHQQQTPQLLKRKKLMQKQEDHSNPIQALNVDPLKVDLVIIQNTCFEKEDSNSETASSNSVKESSLDYATKDVHAIKYKMSKAKERCMAYFRSLHSYLQVLSKEDLKGTHIEHEFKRAFIQYERRVNKRQIQTQESKIDTGKAVDADLVITKSSGTESEVQDDNSMSGNDTDADDPDIRPIYDDEPMAMEKIFAIAALKNNLRKLKGNGVDTKFAKTSVLGKPVLQSLRNQSVVRQPNAFKSERPQMSKPWFASQVDVNNNLSRPVTQHYLPKRRESTFAKPDHMIASSSSRNSSKNMPRFSLNDIVHNHYLEEAKKKTQEKDRNSKYSVMHSASLQNTTNGSKLQPRVINQTTRSLLVSKSSYVTIMVVPKVDHSKNSSSFSDSKHFVYSTCHKCVFNENHDVCITKFLKEVNSRAKSSAVYEKTSPRSDLRWKPTGRIFKTIGLRWVPTGKILASCTSKDDSEPTHSSNVDIPNIHKCKETLDLSAGPFLEFHRTLMMGIRLCFNRLTSRSIISTSSSTKRSLSSMCISSNGTANGSSDKCVYEVLAINLLSVIISMKLD